MKNREGYRVTEYKIIPHVCPEGTEENNEKTLSIACLSAQHVSKMFLYKAGMPTTQNRRLIEKHVLAHARV
jgi:hypothetical protein